MKIPTSPPDMIEIMKSLSSPSEMVKLTNVKAIDYKGRYLHWDQMKYRKVPEGITLEQYWLGTKMARHATMKLLAFSDRNGVPFKYSTPDNVSAMLHEIDRDGIGYMHMAAPIATSPMMDMYLVRSLVEEAISSSQLEGASTSRRVAKEMILKDRKPKNQSERMILNNFRAMEFVSENKDDELTPEMILELHRITTNHTLENEDDAGRIRSFEDNVRVFNVADGETLHVPPPAEELPNRIQKLCDFANGKHSKEFLHPVVRAILLHFMLAYDHPFVDGNGRTARALFYWSMLNQRYWLLEFTSISKIIKSAPTKYGYAFLHSETDGNDVTYFIIHQLEVIKRAIGDLHEYLQKKANDFREATELLAQTQLNEALNHRQINLLEHALKNPGSVYQFKEHQNLHKVTYQTARSDLLKMADDLGLLLKIKKGSSFAFIAPADLKERIANVRVSRVSASARATPKAK